MGRRKCGLIIGHWERCEIQTSINRMVGDEPQERSDSTRCNRLITDSHFVKELDRQELVRIIGATDRRVRADPVDLSGGNRSRSRIRSRLIRRRVVHGKCRDVIGEAELRSGSGSRRITVTSPPLGLRMACRTAVRAVVMPASVMPVVAVLHGGGVSK